MAIPVVLACQRSANSTQKCWKRDQWKSANFEEVGSTVLACGNPLYSSASVTYDVPLTAGTWRIGAEANDMIPRDLVPDCSPHYCGICHGDFTLYLSITGPDNYTSAGEFDVELSPGSSEFTEVTLPYDGCYHVKFTGHPFHSSILGSALHVQIRSVFLEFLAGGAPPAVPELQVHAPERIGPADVVQARVSGIPPASDITWRISRYEPDFPENRLTSEDVDIDEHGVMTVADDSDAGWITVEATAADTSVCSSGFRVSAETRIYISGCSSCTSGMCQFGTGDPEIGSVRVEWPLGTVSSGKSAGRLFLNANTMTPGLATPAMLFYSRASAGVEEIESVPGVLRQVLAPQGLADIVVLNDYAYEIRFYAASDAGSKDGSGLYQPTATPFVVWTVENPDASPTTYTRLRLTKTSGADSVEYEYVWDEANRTWTLTSGNGLVIDSKQEIQLSSSDRQEIRTLENASGQIASKVATTYRTFSWGEAVIEEVVDPDGAALTTTTTYSEAAGSSGYGRVHTVTNPDGSQVEYGYNADGTLQQKSESWLDTANARVTAYDYTPIAGSGDDGSVNPQAARTITETVSDVVTARTYRVYVGDTEIVEQAADASAAYGDARNQRTTTGYYADTEPEVRAGKVQQTTSSDGRSTTYTYDQGTLNIGVVDNPNDYIFTPGTGTARRTIVTQGPETAGKTTRTVTLYDAQGFQVLSATEVYTGSGYARID